MSDLPAYYAARAAEYERIYDKPERQEDLEVLAKHVAAYFDEAQLLELACGTGWWTQHAAAFATGIVGVDINEEVLEIARTRTYACNSVRFVCADLGSVDLSDKIDADTTLDAALVAHWWSHVDRREQGAFYASVHRHLQPGARVMLLDNRFVEGSSTAIARTDGHGNSYQLRGLDSGATYEVMKNFPAATELENSLNGIACNLRYVELDFYWYVTYQLA